MASTANFLVPQFKPNSDAFRASGNRTLNGFLCVSHKLIKTSHGSDKWVYFFCLGVSEVFGSDNVCSVSEPLVFPPG